MKQTKVLVILSCLHTTYWTPPAPRVGERVYCFMCGAYRDTTEAPHDYAVFCQSCTYAKECGNALITAETAAVKHATRRPGHRVHLVDGEQEIRSYRHEPLPANVEVPPF